MRFGHSALGGLRPPLVGRGAGGRLWSPPRPTRSPRSRRSASTRASSQVTREAPAWFHPGRSGALKLGPKVTLGVFGELHPDTLAALDVDAPIAAFELYLDASPPAEAQGHGQAGARGLRPSSRCGATSPSCSMRTCAAGDVVRAASSADRALIADVGVFDVFTGQGVPDGKKSLAIEVTLQPRDKTLTDAEIEAVAEKIVAAVAKATGGKLR